MIAFRSACAILGVTLAAAVATAETHAATPKPKHGIGTALLMVNGKSEDIPPPPSTPCNLGNRMTVDFIDGWMYTCDCEVLAHGFHCQWNLVGKVESVAARRWLRAHHYFIVGRTGSSYLIQIRGRLVVA